MKFRTGTEEAAKAASNPFAHLSLDARRDLCMRTLEEVGARNVQERAGHEIYHSCLLPFGNHSHGDNNPSASVNYAKMTAGCFVCGGGGWLWWVAAIKGLDTSDEARKWVAERTTKAEDAGYKDVLDFLQSLLDPKDPVTPYQPPVYDASVLDKWAFIHPYLTEIRHVPVENIERLRVGYGVINVPAINGGRVNSHRIVIPHFVRGKLVGWQSRRLTNDGTAKYINTPDIPRDTTLYNFQAVTGGDLCIVESPMTVIRHSHHAHLSATFGCKVHDRQIETILSADSRRIVLWFDNDPAGWNATETVGGRIAQRCAVWAVDSPYAGDPGDLTDEQFLAVLSEHVVPLAVWKRPNPEALIPGGV